MESKNQPMNASDIGGPAGVLNGPDTSWRPSRYEVFIWSVLAFILSLAALARAGMPGFGNDGYRYLSVAENIRHGNGIKTSVVYFDSERAHGTIPAPLTTYPLGLTALVATTGVGAQVAAVGFSLVSFALLPLTFWLAMPAGIRP
jgi:hypothetical protein